MTKNEVKTAINFLQKQAYRHLATDRVLSNEFNRYIDYSNRIAEYYGIDMRGGIIRE